MSTHRPRGAAVRNSHNSASCAGHIRSIRGAYSLVVADVLVVGAAATRERSSGRRTSELAYLTAVTAMADAGLHVRDIPAVFVGCGGTGRSAGAEAISVRLGLRRLGFRGEVCGLEHEQSARIEHTSTTAGEALQLAWQAVQMGLYDLVLCIGAECAPAAQGRNGGFWPSAAVLRGPRRRGVALHERLGCDAAPPGEGQ
jgi:acetyl-CoA acetyltransferase